MKIKANYKLRKVAGETIIVNQGTTEADITRIISLNSSAQMLWENLSGKEFTVEDAAQLLVDTYGIGQEQAMNDASAWIDALKGCDVI